MNHIIPYKQLSINASEIQTFLDTPIPEDPNTIIQYGSEVSSYMAYTGKMLADAKYYLNKKKNEETMNVINTILSKSKISAKVQNSLMDSICRDEQYLVDWIDRLNRACTHQLDWCRSVLSWSKEEIRQSNGIR